MKKILFVCTANWYRSRFAEEYFQNLVSIFNLDIYVSSAGFDISAADKAAERLGEMSPLTKFKLKSLGIMKEEDDSINTIKTRNQITQRHFDYFDKIVALDRTEHLQYLKNYSVNHDKLLLWDIADVQFGGVPSKVFLEIQGNCEKLISTYWLNEELWNENL